MRKIGQKIGFQCDNISDWHSIKIRKYNQIDGTFEGIFIGYYGYMDVIRMSYDGNRLGIHYDGYSNNQYIEYML